MHTSTTLVLMTRTRLPRDRHSALSGLLPLLFCLLPLAAAPCRADLIKQGTAYNRTVLMTSSSDHITGATGLTLSVRLAKAGGAPATISDTVTEQGSGRYSIALVGADTSTLGALDMTITATGADPSDTHDQVVLDLPGASVSSVTGAVGSVASPVTAGTVSDKSGFSLASAQAFNNTGQTTSQPATVGNFPTTVSLSPADETKIAAIGSDTPGVGTLLARPAQTGDAYGLLNGLLTGGSVFKSSALANAPTGSGGGSGLTAQQVANAVWDEPTAGHTTAGTFGPFITALPAADAAAVGNLTTEPGETLIQTFRLIRAVLAGNSSVSGATVTFKRKDGSTGALTISNDALGNRTNSTPGTLN